jgi:cell division cycle 20-like protein 1 (cofactor of APC complex)
LAVGTLAGRLHIYDAHTLQLQRTYQQAHMQRIGALAWNTHILSSGSRDRTVHHRDVREATARPFKRCTGHRQEVCGLKWSSDGGPSAATLASGGNDNKVCIWDLRGSRRPGMAGAAPTTGSGDDGPGDSPLWKFHEHTAAVKALAWDPHVSGVLATGGGTQDKHIRFWNVINGTMLHELDTGSQVSLSRAIYSAIQNSLNCILGLQSHLVSNVPRTGLDAWVLIHDGAEPNLHLEVPDVEHGGVADGAHESCAVSGDEPGRRDHRHWRGR